MASAQGPPQPKAILRGHGAQVHAAAFIRRNARLVTGDADGFVVVWDLTIMRPRAVWQPHRGAMLGVAEWGEHRLITHGRDNKIIVWKFAEADEAAMSTVLPLDPVSEPRPQPWVAHILEVNTMNFCTFASCEAPSQQPETELLIAVPNTLASEAVDIFHLPSQRRMHTVKLSASNGMVMALELFTPASGSLTMVAGYENGLAVVAELSEAGTWDVLYRARRHSQPILSLDVSSSRDFFLTSSADALLVKHPIPRRPAAAKVSTTSNATTPATPSVLEFQQATPASEPKAQTGKSLLSAGLTGTSASPSPHQPAKRTEPVVVDQPLKTINTKHAGQQDLRLRSDGRIFATAGWDARVRVYSAKTMKELAVLKWHQVGCYAIAFAEVATVPGASDDASSKTDDTATTTGTGPSSGDLVAVPKLVDVTVKDARIRQAKNAHWLAAGSKDGKVSLWDVF